MSTDKKQVEKPSPHIAGKFEVVGVLPGVIVTKKHGDVDLRTISAEMADTLVKEGFRYLKRVEKQAKEVEKTPSEKK